MQKNSFNYDELIACGKGDLFGEGNAKLPLPPMLMFDRISEIKENIGEFKLVNKFKYIETTDIMNNDLDAFSDVVRNLSSEFNTELLDLRKKFKDYISKNNMENLSKGILTYDGVHLNNEGNKLIADEMIKFLN